MPRGQGVALDARGLGQCEPFWCRVQSVELGLQVGIAGDRAEVPDGFGQFERGARADEGGDGGDEEGDADEADDGGVHEQEGFDFAFGGPHDDSPRDGWKVKSVCLLLSTRDIARGVPKERARMGQRSIDCENNYLGFWRGKARKRRELLKNDK